LKDRSAEIEALLKKMTIEEKVGQMTQLEIGQITSGGDSNIQIDPVKLEKAIVQYKVGSILNVNGHALPVEKWWEIIGAIQAASAKTRLKIPNIYGIDSIHGGNWNGGDLESTLDAKSDRNYGDGNSCGGNSLELFSGFRRRSATTLGSILGDLW
jgi:hypothetical protein